MNTIVELVGLSVLVVMWTSWFGPAQAFKEVILKLENIRFGWILSCPKCMGFWTGLIVFEDFYKAGIVALLSYLVSYLIDRVEYFYQK